MYAYLLLTEVYCQSATGVKNIVVFYYIRLMILFCLIHVIRTCTWFVQGFLRWW